MNEYLALVSWYWGRKEEVLGEKHAPVSLCSPQTHFVWNKKFSAWLLGIRDYVFDSLLRFQIMSHKLLKFENDTKLLWQMTVHRYRTRNCPTIGVFSIRDLINLTNCTCYRCNLLYYKTTLHFSHTIYWHVYWGFTKTAIIFLQRYNWLVFIMQLLLCLCM